MNSLIAKIHSKFTVDWMTLPAIKVLKSEFKLLKGSITTETDKDTNNLIEKHLDNIDYPHKSIGCDAESYVSHPINAFHLMKRTSNWMSKIKHQLENKTQDLNSARKHEVEVKRLT